MAEVFGFPINNSSEEAKRHRANKLCPFNNKVPNCTKDKAQDPLGVCSVFEGSGTSPVVTCPVRFREDWLIADHAAAFFFPPEANWTSLTEVRLADKHGKSAGNIDLVLVSYDDNGKITDFGSCEVQAVYISGNIRTAFEYFMEDPDNRGNMDWKGANYPRPDFLSSSRKRLAPQLLFKGGIIKGWSKKQAVVLDRAFYQTLPTLPVVDQSEADLAWLIYELPPDGDTYKLTLSETVYTSFQPTLLKVTTADAGPVEDFMKVLQTKLNVRLNSPDAPILGEAVTMEDFE